MSSKSVLQECQVRVSSKKGVLQECHLSVSRPGVPQVGLLENVINKFCFCSSTYVSAFGFVGFILFLIRHRRSLALSFLHAIWLKCQKRFSDGIVKQKHMRDDKPRARPGLCGVFGWTNLAFKVTESIYFYLHLFYYI